MNLFIDFMAPKRRGFPLFILVVGLAFAALLYSDVRDSGWTEPRAVSALLYAAIACEALLEWGIAFGASRRDVWWYRIARGLVTVSMLGFGALMVPAADVVQATQGEPFAGAATFILLACALLMLAGGVARLLFVHGHLRQLCNEAMQPVRVVVGGPKGKTPQVQEAEFMACTEDRSARVRLQLA